MNSLRGDSSCPLFPRRIIIEFVSFYGVRITKNLGKKPSERGENQQQTQPTCDAGPGIEPRP